MGLNSTVSAERVHIAFFGMRNAGKSSLVNAVTGQKLSVVSPVAGTTTDPVKKAMELLPLGPVQIIDTPGIDDIGELGKLRVEKAKQVLRIADVAVLVVDSTVGITNLDRQLIALFDENKIPFLIAYNKSDIANPEMAMPGVLVSAATGFGVEQLKEKLAKIASEKTNDKKIVADLLPDSALVVLVVPIDSSAPKGRIILPQQMVLRELLDAGHTVVVSRETELEKTYLSLSRKPDLVITDSQVFRLVDKNTPHDVLLTSFSILLARYKGALYDAVEGAEKLSRLCDGDNILISEGCSHHRQCEDIGTVKLPKWITEFSGKNLNFRFTSGGDFPDEFGDISLIVHCGGCMLNEREMQSRKQIAKQANVAMTNYGIAIAKLNGILDRALAIFPEYSNK